MVGSGDAISMRANTAWFVSIGVLAALFALRGVHVAVLSGIRHAAVTQAPVLSDNCQFNGCHRSTQRDPSWRPGCVRTVVRQRSLAAHAADGRADQLGGTTVSLARRGLAPWPKRPAAQPDRGCGLTPACRAATRSGTLFYTGKIGCGPVRCRCAAPGARRRDCTV